MYQESPHSGQTAQIHHSLLPYATLSVIERVHMAKHASRRSLPINKIFFRICCCSADCSTQKPYGTGIIYTGSRFSTWPMTGTRQLNLKHLERVQGCSPAFWCDYLKERTYKSDSSSHRMLFFRVKRVLTLVLWNKRLNILGNVLIKVQLANI